MTIKFQIEYSMQRVIYTTVVYLRMWACDLFVPYDTTHSMYLAVQIFLQLLHRS